MNFNEFAETVKQKYPQYKDIDNKLLAERVIEKYPVYKDRVEFEVPKAGILDKLGKTEETIKQFRSGVGNTIAGGIQSAIPARPQVPAQTAQEAALRTLGGVAKTAMGDPENVSRAVQLGARASADMAMPTPTETAVSLATGGVLGLAGKAVKKLAPVFSKEAKLAMFDKTKKIIYEQNNKAVESFGNSLKQLAKDNPEKMVNLSEIVDDFKLSDVAGMADPKVKSVVNSVPKLRELFSGKYDGELTAAQTQDVINTLEGKLPEGVLIGKKTLKPSELELRNLINDIKSAQADTFPEMLSVRKDYGQFKNAYKSIKKKLINDNFYNNLEKIITGENQEIVKREFDKVFPKEIIRELGGYAKTAKTVRVLKNVGVDLLKWGGIIGGGGYLAGQVAKDITK